MNWFSARRQPPQERSGFDELFDMSAEELDSEFREATIHAAMRSRGKGAPISGLDENGCVIEIDAEGHVGEASQATAEKAGAD